MILCNANSPGKIYYGKGKAIDYDYGQAYADARVVDKYIVSERESSGGGNGGKMSDDPDNELRAYLCLFPGIENVPFFHRYWSGGEK